MDAKPALVFSSLSLEHLDALYAFELENRAWFESLIAARGDHFYCLSGVKAHVLIAEENMRLGTHYYGVLTQGERILARGNLSNINLAEGRATVGYRVARSSIGKGYASRCLSELVCIAKNTFGIDQLDALVLDNNPASKAVLRKQGFVAEPSEDKKVSVNGQELGCTAYRYTGGT